MQLELPILLTPLYIQAHTQTLLLQYRLIFFDIAGLRRISKMFSSELGTAPFQTLLQLNILCVFVGSGYIERAESFPNVGEPLAINLSSC